ncbi:unnamed protein product, partial [Chrysoparadoxa australica]
MDVFEAIQMRNWEAVKGALSAQACDQGGGAYPLHWLAGEGNVECMEIALNSGAEVDARDRNNQATALHWAAAKGHLHAVRMLLMREATVNERDSNLRTPLHWAAGNGQVMVIKELLFWGARVELLDTWRKSALHWACYRGHYRAVMTLVGRGGDPNVRDSKGVRPGEAFHRETTRTVRNLSKLALKANQGDTSRRRLLSACNVAAAMLKDLISAGCGCEEATLLLEDCKSLKHQLRAAITEGVSTEVVDDGDIGMMGECLSSIDSINDSLKLYENTCVTQQPGKPLPPLPQILVPGGQGQGFNQSTQSRGESNIGRTYSTIANTTAPSSSTSTANIASRHAPQLTTGCDTSASGTTPSVPGGAPTPTRMQRLSSSNESATLQIYPFYEIREACQNFSEPELLGQGGFGKVYKGTMRGNRVAVKKLDEGGLQGRSQFAREVEILTICRHPNVVPLLGVCTEPPCLVYRLMPNNSLREHLKNVQRRSSLGWRLRVRIALDVSHGLQYLHHESDEKPKVVHSDVKPENILLDERFRARLADFGISKVGSHDNPCCLPRHPLIFSLPPRFALNKNNLQGDFHYICPEFAQTGRATESSDVYAFGICML